MATTATKETVTTGSAVVADRGSDKVLEQWLGRDGQLTQAELKSLLKIQFSKDTKLVRAFKRGIPRPDVLVGTIRTTPNQAGSVIQQLVNIREVQLNCEVFPLGIPFPDEVLINFTNLPGNITG